MKIQLLLVLFISSILISCDSKTDLSSESWGLAEPYIVTYSYSYHSKRNHDKREILAKTPFTEYSQSKNSPELSMDTEIHFQEDMSNVILSIKTNCKSSEDDRFENQFEIAGMASIKILNLMPPHLFIKHIDIPEDTFCNFMFEASNVLGDIHTFSLKKIRIKQEIMSYLKSETISRERTELFRDQTLLFWNLSQKTLLPDFQKTSKGQIAEMYCPQLNESFKLHPAYMPEPLKTIQKDKDRRKDLISCRLVRVHKSGMLEKLSERVYVQLYKVEYIEDPRPPYCCGPDPAF